jgi:integrating conjugative element protein (TIGR03752 family)
MAMRTNKLVWIGLGGLLFLVVVVAVNALQKKPPETTVEQKKAVETKKTVQTVDGDTIEETLRQVQLRYEASQEENKQLKDVLAKLDERIGLQEEKSGTAKGDNRIDTLLNQLRGVESNMSQLTSQIMDQQKKYSLTETNGYSFGGSTDDYSLGKGKKGGGESEYRVPAPRLEGYVSVSPVSQTARYTGDASGSLSAFNDRLDLDGALSLVDKNGDKTANQLSKKKIVKQEDVVTPYYTIPARATLLDNVAMTAIIGRVPVGDTLKSPFPVKIIVGNKNLATNGLKIPGLKGIVFEGIASGNWNLACASVSLSAATFTFEDGRVQHLYGSKSQGKNEIASLSPIAEGGAARGAIGYVSNPQGVPCIPGKRVTDAPKQLASLTFLGMAASYFEAKAEAERETVLDSSGNALQAVTGDKENFVNNRTAQDTVGTVQNFYQQRNRDTFDAIVVPAGEKVVIHVTSDLLVDYHTAARKLVYTPNEGKNYASQLD